MLKKASKEEAISETFVCRFGKALGFNMAEYSALDGYVSTVDFTENSKYDFEPAYNLVWDNDDLIFNIQKLEQLDNTKSLVYDYMKIIFMDTLAANPDRHTFNYGVLRNSDTGKLISMAPNFDNNMALIARNDMSKTDRTNDFLVNEFLSALKAVPEFKEMLPEITPDIIFETLDTFDISNDLKKRIVQFIYNGYEIIKKETLK